MESRVQPRWLFSYTLFTAAATLVLLGAGALVTGTGSSLSVPDWPLSFGQYMPPMVGGVMYEHGHRMIAAAVGIFTLLLTILLWRFENRFWLRVLGMIALLSVIVQALLGGLTVLLRLPAMVSVAHALLAQTFFCLVVILTWGVSPSWERSRPTRSAPASLKFFALGISLLFFSQLFMGAWMRHLGAGLVIPDFPTSFGVWIPPLENILVRVHFLHRLGAFFILFAVGAFAIKMYSMKTAPEEWVTATGVLLSLVLMQVVLGAVTIWAARPVVVTTLHLMVGALCLATSVVLTISVFRQPPSAETS